MNQLHPVMADALKPFMPGMQRCAHVSPAEEKGTTRFYYTLHGIDLACDIEYEAEERGSRERGVQMEPDYPATATVCNVYVRDIEISALLDCDQKAEIEEAFLCGGDE